jgi:hypothetical protein
MISFAGVGQDGLKAVRQEERQRLHRQPEALSALQQGGPAEPQCPAVFPRQRLSGCLQRLAHSHIACPAQGAPLALHQSSFSILFCLFYMFCRIVYVQAPAELNLWI